MTTGQDSFTWGGAFSALWHHLWPVVSLGVGVLLAAEPATRSPVSIVAYVPVLVIVYWQTSQAGALSAWVMFAAGLFLDCVSHGPVGYWALIFLAGWALAGEQAHAAGNSAFAMAAIPALVLLAEAGLQAAISVGFAVEVPALSEVGTAMAVCLLAFPVLAGGLSVLTLDRRAQMTATFPSAGR